MTAINRRSFLASLAALGAAIVLPDKATSAQVDSAWKKLLTDPWYFVVNDSRTIVGPDGQEPRFNRDVYDDIHYGETSEALVNEVDRYDELRGHFQQLAADELGEVDGQLGEEDLSLAKRKKLMALRAALQDADDGWKSWVRLGGPQQLPQFQRAIDMWLAEPVNWSGSEFWPRGWSSQGKALMFFQQMEDFILDELGVVIVEGDHPGSTYFAAELRAPVAEANHAAKRLDLPFRFR